MEACSPGSSRRKPSTLGWPLRSARTRASVNIRPLVSGSTPSRSTRSVAAIRACSSNGWPVDPSRNALVSTGNGARKILLIRSRSCPPLADWRSSRSGLDRISSEAEPASPRLMVTLVSRNGMRSTKRSSAWAGAANPDSARPPRKAAKWVRQRVIRQRSRGSQADAAPKHGSGNGPCDWLDAGPPLLESRSPEALHPCRHPRVRDQ